MNYTLTFDERVKGWTSFHSYVPDKILSLNNKFYTIKDGQLWEHHAEEEGVNNFYGELFSSVIKTIINDQSYEDKIFKTMILESIAPWKTTLRTNYTQSSIKLNEYNKRESKWFAYTRQNELETDLNGSTQGLGEIDLIEGLKITFGDISHTVSTGDSLYQIVDDEKQLIGTIEQIEDNVITVNSFTNAPLFDAFCYSKKDSRIEGSELRGYFLEIELEDVSEDQNELFGVSSNVVKSYL